MEDGPLSTYEGIKAAFAKAKAEKERQEAQGVKAGAPDAEQANKQGEIRFKAAHGLLVAFFCWMLLLHLLGIYLFTSGFLLTRLVLDHKSDCAVPPASLSPRYDSGSAQDGCWYPKTFEKAVVIIVDALRYDFTVPFLPETSTETSTEAPHYFHNSVPFLYETASRYPHNAFLRPFIADPPTTTLQRLKGLTTGTLPTFIDAGSNFAGTAIEEDNLVAQLRNASKRVVHLGDDTWHALFPGHFEPNLTRAYDSFNVWDLHTVDNGVTEHLFPLLDPANATKWDVIFGHYLGVDHAGHRYGPDHPAMAAKLRQMDDVIRKITESLDDETLLVVMGDHGMDAKGDHGGESDDEIQAALWMYSKKGVFGRSSPMHQVPPAHAKERPVAQIDLVPTLSLLLGMPIPFNNLGTPIEEAFIGSDGTDLEAFATVNRLAASQIHRYQLEYAKARGLGDDVNSPLRALWDSASASWSEVNAMPNPSSKQWLSVGMAFLEYQRENLNTCKALWARFDIPSMVNGVGMLLGALLVLGIYARAIQGDVTEVTPVLLLRGGAGTVVGAVVGLVLGTTIKSLPAMHTIVLLTVVGSDMGIASAFWCIRNRLQSPFPDTVWGWTTTILTLLLSIGFASNSFTIWEDEILLFFIATFGLMLLVSSLRQQKASDRALGCYHAVVFLLLSRVASLSRLCREEQMPFCKSTYYASATSSTSAVWQLTIPFILAFLLPNVIRSYYNGTLSYRGSAPLWIGFAFRIGLILSAVYWTMDAADDGEWLGPDKPWLKDVRVIVAQLVFGIALAAGYSIFAWSPPLLSIETGAPSNARAGTGPQQKPSGSGAPSSITILGYHNVHGSRYFLLFTMWLLAAILVQKPMGGGALGLLAWQIMSLLELVDINSLSDTSVGPVVLALLGSFYFFKTGHQAALSTIQWESAFIPLKTIRYPWSPLLVVLNTFAAQILCAVAVPALVLWKQKPKKTGLLGDVARATATHLLFYAVLNASTTMWAGWLRRHLMLYRIFSPRFMTGAAALLIVDLAGIFIALGGTRWSFLSAGEVFGWVF